MTLVLAVLLLVGTPAAEIAVTPAVAEPEATPVDLNAIGLGLAAGGAVLATSTAVTATLVEALNTPDQDGQPRNELVIQGSGLLATGLVSVGAAMMLCGGVLLIDGVLLAPGRAAEAKPAPPQE